MNESILISLKTLVERVVRPLRASMSYKQRVRDELLAHVSSVYLEELSKLGEEPAALERTAQRFGEAAELTGQLQRAVPGRDGLYRLADSLFGFGSSQSTWHRSIRHAVSGGIHCAVAIGLIAIPVEALMPERLHAFLPLYGPLCLAALCVFVSGLMFLAHWMCPALFGEAGVSWQKTILIALASGMLLPMVTFGVCLGLAAEVWSSFLAVVPLGILAIVLTPPIVFLFAWRLSIEIRAHDDWANLSIE
jgi:hypothetical protein